MSSRESRTVFVIMPFTKSPTRGEAQLTSFFENNIKQPIEAAALQYKYHVHRSGDAFNITDTIINDLYDADIVIADLSGDLPNPNVMYELGVRLSVSNRPVILIREAHGGNVSVFDISQFYTFDYDPLNYSVLETHLVKKLARFESGEETYRSPVREVLTPKFAMRRAAQASLSPAQQRELALRGIARVGEAVGRAFGPQGKAVRRQLASGVTRARRGIAIAGALESSDAVEQAGISFCRQLAEEVDHAMGDGTKICLALFAALVQEGERHVREGERWTSVVEAIEDSAHGSRRTLTTGGWRASIEDVVAVAGTAARSRRIGFEIARLMDEVGSDGLIRLELGSGATDETALSRGYKLRTGYVSESLLADTDRDVWERRSARLLLYCDKIAAIPDVVPVMEMVARSRQPLLLLAKDVEGDALAAIELNNRRKITDVMVVRIPGLFGRSLPVFEDLAIYTGGSVIAKERGLSLKGATEAELGQVARVTVDKANTLISGGGGSSSDLSGYVDRLTAARQAATEHEAELLSERISMLTGRIGTVTVGGATEDDRRRRYGAWESAMHAARVAGTAPVILGGGKPLAVVATRAAGVGADVAPQDVGEIFALAALEPLKALAQNARGNPAQILEAILSAGEQAVSLEARTGEMANLRKRGVLDSLAVWDRAIEVAVSGVRTFFETSRWLS